nr:MAG TPA: hypothetical protein [Caudoviricetes sp.]
MIPYYHIIFYFTIPTFLLIFYDFFTCIKS